MIATIFGFTNDQVLCFLCGSLTMSVIWFLCYLRTERRIHKQTMRAIAEAQERAYRLGYQKGVNNPLNEVK